MLGAPTRMRWRAEHSHLTCSFYGVYWGCLAQPPVRAPPECTRQRTRWHPPAPVVRSPVSARPLCVVSSWAELGLRRRAAPAPPDASLLLLRSAPFLFPLGVVAGDGVLACVYVCVCLSMCVCACVCSGAKKARGVWGASYLAVSLDAGERGEQKQIIMVSGTGRCGESARCGHSHVPPPGAAPLCESPASRPPCFACHDVFAVLRRDSGGGVAACCRECATCAAGERCSCMCRAVMPQ